MESRNSCSVNPQLVWDMQNSKKNLMPIQICLYSFNSVAYGSQNQLFDALQEGKWQAGKPVLSADSTYGRFCVFQLHKHLCLSWGRKYIKLGELYSKKSWLYSHHSYGPTVNHLLPGASRIFKALWHQSEECKTKSKQEWRNNRSRTVFAAESGY